jgi:hypothetical protein
MLRIDEPSAPVTKDRRDPSGTACRTCAKRAAASRTGSPRDPPFDSCGAALPGRGFSYPAVSPSGRQKSRRPSKWDATSGRVNWYRAMRWPPGVRSEQQGP